MRSTLKFYAQIIILIAGLQNGFAQAPNWQWAHGAGMTGSEAAQGTAIDGFGNMCSIGWYTSANITFGPVTLTNAGSGTGDVFLVKHDAAGNALWAKTFGGIDGDVGNGISVDASGNIYITGWYSSPTITFGTYTLTNSGSSTSDIFIVKLNQAGTTLWAKNAGGALADRGLSIKFDASGNVFVTGGFSSATANFGSTVLTNAGTSNDFFIAKYDTNGNELWAKSAGGSSPDVGYSVATDTLGNAYVTGMFSSTSINFGTGALTNAGAATQDLFAVKYNASGTAVWSSRHGGSADDYGNGIAVKKNNVYITGGFVSPSISFGGTTLNNAGTATSDVLTVKFDLAGNTIWGAGAGDIDSEAGNAIALDAFGNVFICGYYGSNTLMWGTNSLTNNSPGTREVFVASYTYGGATGWIASATGGVYDEIGYGVAVNGAGTDVYAAGMFNSYTGTFGTNSISKGCGDDVFVAKLIAPAMVGIKEEILKDKLLVYPNPTTGKFMVKAAGKITIYNALGEIILTEKLTGFDQLDLSCQPKGVYLFQISDSKNAQHTGRVVVE